MKLRRRKMMRNTSRSRMRRMRRMRRKVRNTVLVQAQGIHIDADLGVIAPIVDAVGRLEHRLP
eukprot:2109432-Pyramimonas_sp.AAC.1